MTYGQGGWSVVDGAPTDDRFNDVSFINDSAGYIGNGYWIYKTVNKGDTWLRQQQLSKPLYFRSLEFLDDSLGFAGVLANPDTKPGLYITRNGGNSLESINHKVDINLNGICGLDHKGNTIIGVGIYSVPSAFIVSKDRGETWKSIVVPFAKGLVDCLILNDSTYLVSGTRINELNKSTSVILKTNNSGKTWRVVATNTKASSYCWKLFIDKNGFGIGSIEFDKSFFVTYDFGDHWELKEINGLNASYGNFGGTAFLNDSIGWLGVQWGSSLLETRDGGQSWKWLSFGNNINRIVILDENTAIAVGETVYKYKSATLNTQPNIKEIPFHTFKISPTPADRQITFEMDLLTGTEMRLDLLNESGAIQKLLFMEVLSRGNHKYVFDVSEFSSGVYYIWIRCNEGHRLLKTIIRH